MGLDKFVDWVVVLWGVPSLVAAGVFYLLYRTLKTAGTHQGDKDWLAQKAKRMHRPYKATLEAVLQWLERVLKPETVEDNPIPEKGWMDRLAWWLTPRAANEADAEKLTQRPWSWPVLTAAITLAVIYPMFAVGMQWALTKSMVGMGGLQFLPKGVHWTIRSLLIGSLIAALFARLFLSTSNNIQSEKLSMRILFGALITAFFIASSIANAGSGTLALPFAIAVLCALSFLGAGVLVVASSSFGAIAGGFLGGSLEMFLIAGMLSVVVSTWTARKTGGGFGVIYYLGLLLTCVASGFCVTFATDVDEAVVLIVTLLLLPSINAIFDWLSYGWTIFLLQWGRQKKGIAPFLAGLADIAMAAVIFALLATTLVIVFAQINLIRGEVLVDVQAILDDPGAHVWVIAMVASTLLPTLVHLGLAALSVITWVPLPFWGGLVARLDPEQSAVLSNLSAAALALSLMVLYALPIVAIGGVLWLLWQHSGWVLDGYLWWLQLVLDWMGSPPIGGFGLNPTSKALAFQFPNVRFP